MGHKNRSKFHRATALLLLLALILAAAVGGTLAHLFTQTPSLVNTFLSGLAPTGDLLLCKEVAHPFGEDYSLPASLGFEFTVALGEDFSEKTVASSRGELTADSGGNLLLTLAPGETLRLPELPEGLWVTVTEHPLPGFTPEGGAEQTLTLQQGENRLVYTNTYAPAPVSRPNITLDGTKLLEGRDWQQGDAFSFRLEYKQPGQEQDWQLVEETTVTYDPDDPDFDRFTFTDAVQSLSFTQTGDYAFRISEVEGSIGGITYDKAVSYFDVTVTDEDMDGALELRKVSAYQNAEAAYDPETDTHQVNVTVCNRYAPAGSATVAIQLRKEVRSLSGKDISPAGYTFELYDETGALIATSDKTSAAGETAIELTFEAAQAGTQLRYTLQETGSGQTLKGITYDAARYPVTVSLLDGLDGTLQAQIWATDEMPDDATDSCLVRFCNTYDPTDAAYTLTGTKTLTGRALQEGEFTFTLTACDESFAPLADEPSRQAANLADGSFTFETMTYDTVGTYCYLLQEDTTEGRENITYDDTVYGIRVTVSDDGSGVLTADALIRSAAGEQVDAPVFENRYIQPPTPTDPTEPSDPAEPTDPTEPSEPSEPTDPTEPSEPTDPSEPSEPSEPTDPTESTEATDPTESTEATGSMDPTGSGEPTDATEAKPTPPSNPQTGDTTPLTLYFVVAGVSLAAMILIAILAIRGWRKKGRYS